MRLIARHRQSLRHLMGSRVLQTLFAFFILLATAAVAVGQAAIVCTSSGTLEDNRLTTDKGMVKNGKGKQTPQQWLARSSTTTRATIRYTDRSVLAATYLVFDSRMFR